MTKRLSLLLLLLFMLSLLLSPLFALEVTIGAGDESAPYPMDFSLGSSLYQTLYYPDELGFSSGTITALEFYNNFTQSLNGRRMQIWLGTTDQADLSGGFIPANHLTMVFDSRVSFPAGENAISITLDTPYIHTPGNLVMMVLRPHDFDTSYSNLFKCQTIGNNRACFCADYNYTVNAYNPPAGMVMGQFPKTKITYTPLTIVNDLGAVSISGNHYPNVGSSSNYTVSVKNNGTASQTNYQVKLMYGSTELASVAGPAINSLETAQVTIPWTPATADSMSIYGKVVLTGDEIATNNETLLLKLLVQPEGTLSITIGEGNETANIPMDFRHFNAIYQCLYYPDELGIVNGTITDIAFYNNFLSEIPEAATKIWLGNTTAQDLSGGWIPSTEMRLVYDGDVDYPSEQNIIAISLQRVFNYDSSNLVMMVQRPVELSWYSHMDLFKCQTRGSTRALRVASDDILLDPTDPGNTTEFVQISGQFPQTTFFCTGQPIERDLSVHSLTGNVTPAVGTAESYIVTVKNNGTVIESNYQVKLMAGDVELASVNGPAIQSGQSLEISLPWTPTAAGPMAICGKVVMTGDQIEVNNRTVPLNIAVQAADVVAVTVGEGDSAHRVPFDFTWGTSLFETIFQASELNIGGEIRGIKFYNRFTHEVGSKPIKIWLGETTQTDLSGGYIPASEMELVFDGNIAFPCGSNDIYIPIDPPWIYGGGNLVMMTNRVTQEHGYFVTNQFVTQTGTIAGRSRNAYEIEITYDPNNPPAGFSTDIFPKTTFYVMPEGMGSLSGTVRGPGNTPIEGAIVSIANSSLEYTTGADGTYSFPLVKEGSQTVSATKHGYTVDTQTVTIVEDQTITQNFNIGPLNQVTVSGRIVSSIQPTVGLANAAVTLSGYEHYSATSNTQGQFTIPNVWANQTYQYLVVAAGHQAAVGQAAVGTTNLNLGDIIVNEMTYPFFAVQAVENDASTQVDISWEAPDPTSTGISEGFEDETFPPPGWTQIITNTDIVAGLYGCHWTRLETIPLSNPIQPTEGDWHVGLWYATDPQDEWLITPRFICPHNGVLTFDTYATYGSIFGDHYYVKISTDNGNTWTVLWDASALPPGTNYYEDPITLPLSNYAGQNIKLAWHAYSGPCEGLNSRWIIDNIFIGNTDRTIRIDFNQLALESASGQSDERVMMGYKVWRLLQGQEDNEAAWTPLTTSIITQTNYTDTAWQTLPFGVYKYAVKAVYTNNVYSNPAFSNEIPKDMIGVLTGTVTDYVTGQPVAAARVVAGDYRGVTNAQGVYSFELYAGTYEVFCSKPGYQTCTQAGVVIAGLQITTQNFVLSELPYPPMLVAAEEAADGSNVSLTWGDPGAGEWLSYCGGPESSIGSINPTNFNVAIRYPVSALADYAGMSLYAVKVFIADPATFAARVWKGYVLYNMGSLVVDQPFTAVPGVYNTIVLNDPVAITGTEELCFGYNIDSPGGVYPAGCDGGPALDRLGNLINLGENQGWFSLLDICYNYNWCIQGYVAYTAPIDAPRISLESLERPQLLTELNQEKEANRALTGYRVWRLLQGQEDNEAAWTSLTASTITQTSLTDNTWQALPSGVYKYAVKTAYPNNAFSNPVFSNEVHKDMRGTLTGTVVASDTNQPLAGAVVKAGEYQGITNAQGVYSFSVYTGTYVVTCAKTGYHTYNQAGVVIVATQTTTQDFVLTELARPPLGVRSELAENNINLTWMEPGTDSQGLEEGFEGDSFPPTGWVQSVTNAQAGAYGTTATWGRFGTVPLNTPVSPPEGDWHAVLWWSLDTQDEWLITPEFYCPYNGRLVFDSYVFLGSMRGDHYYVKVSTDGGENWDQLWDASTTPGGWNRYDTPITVSLGDYTGLPIKLAFHAKSVPGEGLWYFWFIDNVLVETDAKTIRLDLDQCITASGIQPATDSKEAGVTKATLPGGTKELKNGDRILTGYQVWRLLQGQETSESTWISLTTEPITATEFQDTEWSELPDGSYKWAVKAVYTGGAISPPAFSNPLSKITEIGTLVGVVRNSDLLPIAGATINCAEFSTTTNTNGIYSMQVNAGTYSVTASHPEYAAVIQTNVRVVHAQTTTVNFVLQPCVNIFVDGFEAYDDFALRFTPWKLVDVDQLPTCEIAGHDWPNVGQPQAFIIFNPGATTPPLDLNPHGGSKFGACMAAIPGPNDDWLITPLLEDATNIEFWARAIVPQHTERFKVGVSTTGTQPADFTIISGAEPVTATAEWTNYSYHLAGYIGNPIYIGIQCVSSNALMLMVDDVRVTGGTDADDPVVPVLTTALHPNYPNPFNPETTISYSLEQGENVRLEVYNVKGQLIRTLVNGNKPAGNHKVIWNGVDNSNRPVASGVYYYRLTAGKYSGSRRMILMK